MSNSHFMPNSGAQDPNSLLNIVHRATKHFAQIEALSTFSTHMINGGNVSDGIVSASIAASSAPLLGGMLGLTFFKSHPPQSTVITNGLINLYSFIASQAMFYLFNTLIGISVSHSEFTTNTVEGLFVLTILVSLYENLCAKDSQVNKCKGSSRV